MTYEPPHRPRKADHRDLEDDVKRLECEDCGTAKDYGVCPNCQTDEWHRDVEPVFDRQADKDQKTYVVASDDE